MPSSGEREGPVIEGWQRLETANGIPYYSNKHLQKTQWDHPMMKVLEAELKELDKIRFVAYRTAMKLRAVQKNTRMSLIKLTIVKAVFSQNGLESQSEGAAQTMDVSDVQSIIHSLYQRAHESSWGQVSQKHSAELMINWLLNVYDCGRTGKMRVMSLKVGVTTLSQARLEDKYTYLCEQICSIDSHVDKEALLSLLKDMLLIARQLVKAECQAFGGNSPKAGVESCFDFVKAQKRNTITYEELMHWLRAEPQTIVFLPTMHRLAAAEAMKHDAKCNECKEYPIVGMRFRSMKHINVDLCQGCFFTCRGMNNKPKNAQYFHEYCVPATSGEDIKDFAGALKNKVTKGHRKTQSSFLVVKDSKDDADANSGEVSAVSSRPVSDVHEEIGDLADVLRGLEERPSETRPDMDDEHALIRLYATRLAGQSELRSPTQITVEAEGRGQLDVERNIKTLEEDKGQLENELENLKRILDRQKQEQQLQELAISDRDAAAMVQMQRERQDKEILEARIEVLEEYNVQLKLQLQRLRQLLQGRDKKSPKLLRSQAALEEVAPENAVLVNATARAPMTAGVSEEAQLQTVVRNSLTGFPDLLADVASYDNVFSDIHDAASRVGDAMTEFVNDMSHTTKL